MQYNQLRVLGAILPKTEDGYKVKENDLVWCASDPFTITSITLMCQTNDLCETEFTFWLDPDDGEGDYPANNHEVFRYQRNCLLAARRIAIGNIQCDQNSIERARGKILTIDKYLEGFE